MINIETGKKINECKSGAYSLFNKDTNSQPFGKIIASPVNSQLAKPR